MGLGSAISFPSGFRSDAELGQKTHVCAFSCWNS